MVQRFSIMHESFFNPDDKGQFVSYHDYAAIERERDELLQKVQVLEKENALLRKRLEPIETAHREYKNYPSSAIVKRDAYDKAINKCMELKEGE